MPSIPQYTLPAQFQAPAVRPPGFTPFSLNECYTLGGSIGIDEIVLAQISDAVNYPTEIASDWESNPATITKFITETQGHEADLVKLGVPKNSIFIEEIDADISGPFTEWLTQSDGPRDLTSLPMIYAEMQAYYKKIGADCEIYSSGGG